MSILFNRVETMVSWRGIVVSGKAQAAQLKRAASSQNLSLHQLKLTETTTLFCVRGKRGQEIEATLAQRRGFSQALLSAQVKLFFAPQKVGLCHRFDLREFLSFFPNLQGFVPSVPASQARLLARSYIGWGNEKVAAQPVVTVHEATGIRVGLYFPLMRTDDIEARGDALFFNILRRMDFTRSEENVLAKAFGDVFLKDGFREMDEGFCAELIVGKENREGQPDLIWQAEEIALTLAAFEQIEGAYQAQKI